MSTKTRTQAILRQLLAIAPFLFFGSVLSLYPQLSNLIFGASPHYYLIAIGFLFISVGFTVPTKWKKFLYIPLFFMYWLPSYPMLIISGFSCGLLAELPKRNHFSYLFVVLSFFLSSLHLVICLLLFFWSGLLSLTRPTEKKEAWSNPVAIFVGVAFALTSVYPFLMVRTSIFSSYPIWFLYFLGLLLPLPLAYFIRLPSIATKALLLSPAVVYFATGPLVVQLNQAERPFLYELAFMVGLGVFHGLLIAMSLHRSTKTSWLGFGLGLILASVLSQGWGFTLSGCYFLILLFAKKGSTKIISLPAIALFLFGSLSYRGPDASIHLQSLFRSRENQVLSFDASTWNAMSSFSYTPESTAPIYFDDDTAARISLEDSFLLLNDRRASAERYAGLIVRALTSSPQSMLVLGDTTANSFAHIQQHLPDQTYVSTPVPKFTQTVAKANPTRRNILISPEIQLLPFHPQEVISEYQELDIILDILHSPIPNAINQPNTSSRINRIKSSLSNNGLYAQLIHLRDFPKGVPQQQASFVAQSFSHVSVWLPPQGADSLLVVASDQPLDWNLFSNHLEQQRFDSMEIGSLAILNRAAILQWTSASSVYFQYPLQPILHMAELEEYISKPEDVWTEPPAELAERVEVKKRFLRILKKAGDGKVNEVFQEASALFQGKSDPGVTLAPLLAPHIKDAQKSIKMARSEGQTSQYWEEAKKYAMTASMLSPTNPVAKGLLGEIAIGQGLPAVAQQHFLEIIEEDPQNIVAIHGMARIAGLEGNVEEVERWMNEAVAQAGQDWRNHHNLGRFYQQQGKQSRAEKTLKKALSLSPKDSVETRLVLCELYLDQGEATRALLEIERVIKTKPTAKAWFLRGRAYFDLESYKEAEDDFRRATLADPQFHDARGAIGTVKIALGDLEGAAQAFRTTLRFDPGNSAAQQNLTLVEKEIAKRSTPPY